MPTPDPACRWCGGTGIVPMLNALTECDCVKEVPSETDRDPAAAAAIDLMRRHLAVE